VIPSLCHFGSSLDVVAAELVIKVVLQRSDRLVTFELVLAALGTANVANPKATWSCCCDHTTAVASAAA